LTFLLAPCVWCRQLYEVLSQPALARRRVPVLLACNKQDMGSKAHTLEFVRKRLEKEIDQARRGLSESWLPVAH
jgi:signal recognition particle receptor subunit beta